MKYIRKTQDVFIVQGYYGSHGWEDETAEETRTEGLARLKEYRANGPAGFRYRMIVKREKIESEAQN